MSSLNNDENEWIGTQCGNKEICPKTGFWKLIETGELIWHEEGDKFNGRFEGSDYKSANYEYMGKTR